MLSPSRSENLHVYFKRLLHEGSQYEDCCPSCGKSRKGVQKNIKIIPGKGRSGRNKRSWKTQYTCDDCHELWVANFCSDCSYNNRNNLSKDAYDYPRPLYKYPTNNYNIQVRDEWEVHCPTCNKLSYPERPYTLTNDDFLGPNVVYHTRKTQ